MKRPSGSSRTTQLNAPERPSSFSRFASRRARAWLSVVMACAIGSPVGVVRDIRDTQRSPVRKASAESRRQLTQRWYARPASVPWRREGGRIDERSSLQRAARPSPKVDILLRLPSPQRTWGLRDEGRRIGSESANLQARRSAPASHGTRKSSPIPVGLAVPGESGSEVGEPGYSRLCPKGQSGGSGACRCGSQL